MGSSVAAIQDPARLRTGLARVGLGLVAALWPLMSFAGGLGFSPLLALAGLACLPLALRSLSIKVYILFLGTALTYGVLSGAWLQGGLSLVRIDEGSGAPLIAAAPLRIGVTLLWGGILIQAVQRLSPSDARVALRYLAAGLSAQLVVVLLLTVFETEALQLFDGFMSSPAEGVQNISRNQIILSVAAPLLAVLVLRLLGGNRGRALALGVVAAAMAAAWARGVDSAILGLLAALVAGGAILLAPRRGFLFAGVALAVFLAASPALFNALSRDADASLAATSAEWRLAIWNRVSDVIAEAPLTGSGVGVLRAIDETIPVGVFAGERLISGHPHNMFLQVWAEMGAIGAALLGAALVAAAMRMPQPGRIGAAGMLAAALTAHAAMIAMVSFDLWNDWWWSVCCLLATGAVLVRRADGDRSGLLDSWSARDEAD
jgi:hypothetical protein